MTTLYLIRHAEAEGNLYRRIHGQFDTNVTPNGRRQIAALARRFAAVPVDAVYASDLTRTQTTAQAIAAPQGLPLRLEPGFREINLGVWEDRAFGWLYAFETAQIQCFNRAHDGGTAAIFSHGAVMRGVMMALFPEADIPHCDNTAVTCLQYENGRFHISYFNDTSHLGEGLSTLSRQSWWRKDGKRRDTNLWFRPGAAAVEGLTPPDGETFTACRGETPAGLVVLGDGGKAGELRYLGLTAPYRRQGLAVQLLGQAVFTCRAKGKEQLTLTVPDGCAELQPLLRQMDLRPDAQGRCTMDLRLQVFPLPEPVCM